MQRTIVTTAAAALAAASASALQFDQNVTPDAIFGSGNANGGFTTDTNAGVEIGLRGKVRFDNTNTPQNIFNSNGDGSYTFDAGAPSPGFGFAPNNPQAAKWNFEWSINTDVTGGTGNTLSDFTYEIGIDADPTAGTNFLTFDLINDVNGATGTVQWDHSLGDNSTGNGQGVEIFNNQSNAALYDTRINTLNVAQNSWNYLFFTGSSPLDTFDPNTFGEYTIYLAASNSSGEVARSTITINVIPTPGVASLAGLAGIAALRRRRNA